jgi:S-DNA-T family DNA segregation ATPase FtsK/SpoIIIE
MDYILTKEKNYYVENPVSKALHVGSEALETDDVSPFLWSRTAKGKEYLYISGEKVTLERAKVTTVAALDADIRIEGFPFRIILERDSLYVAEAGRPADFYMNGNKIDVDEGGRDIVFHEGDVILADTVKIVLFEKQIVIRCREAAMETSLLETAGRESVFEGFPRYKRSPRLIKRIPTEEIKIDNPPAKTQMSKSSLAQIIMTPIIMLCITIVISIVMRRGIYVIMSAASTVMSVVASITKFVHDKKESAERNKKRQEMYEQYLLDTRKKINRARMEELEALEYNYPSINKIEEMVNGYNSRIYERGSNDDDFLKIMLGSVRDQVSFKINLNYNDLSLDQDELEQEAKSIYDGSLYMDHKPVSVDLKKAHLGVVGEKDVIHEQLKLIVAQLTFFHSYHDLQIINIYDPKYDEDFKWMNWYPHLKLHAMNVYGSINSEKMRDQVLGSMHRIIRERKMKLEESKKEARFLPHYVFIIDEPKLIMDHSIMEYLDKEGDNLGFSIIYTTHLQANLPENIGTIVTLDSSEEGTLLLEEKMMQNRKLRLNRPGDTDFETMARNLSVLIHEQGIVSHIPESITFFEMYGIDTPSELRIEERWKKNESHKSLAVPLGVRAADDILYLNLHEKAHGPHGLVAGTTGSGKSEIVQSYILSLAVNFHPYEVGFLLIDYKGGGMAGLFKDLPHLLGTITNLDGSESMRAMASIKSELSRRQRRFGENNVNHINAYNKLFKLGEVDEPIPHLFLISDEFAELKKEQPEFMTELVSAARIGRSLGIHLILATQKPSGVVDDQIWTNSRFKLALKVQNEADSKEIIKTSDAAMITQPGRAYLQVGNNEIYELFQSAWSGAVYSDEMEEETVDDRVYIINELGQGELINGDLSRNPEGEQIKATQLDVVVNEVNKVYEEQQLPKVKRPWLPPLEYKIVSPSAAAGWMKNPGINSEEEKHPLDLSVTVGMVDIPEEQRQCEYKINPVKDGNTAFFASAGYGKSVFLTTAILSMAMKNHVDNLNFYICDFGNNALIPLNRLPHTADYIAADDNERLSKLVNIINEEIKVRKKLFAEKMVQNFDVYNQSTDTPLKAIVIAIDNYDIVKELGYEVEDFFTRLSRDGAGLGIYLLITATRMSGIKYAAINNYKIKISGYIFDASEANSIVGKCSYKLPEAGGRAFVKMTTVNIMQIYTMIAFKNEVDYNNNLKQLIEEIYCLYPTKRAPRIPVLPDKFEYSMVKDYEGADKNELILGLHKETVKLRGFMQSMSPFLIIGDGTKGKTNMLKVILDQIYIQQGEVYLFDSKNKELYYNRGQGGVQYIDSQSDIDDFVEDFSDMCDRRKALFEKALTEEATLNPREFYGALKVSCIVIDDLDDFIEKSQTSAKEILTCVKKAVETGVGIIATVNSSKPKGFDELTKWFKTSANGLVVGSQGNLSIYPTVPSKEMPVLGEGLLYINGGYEKLLLPHYTNYAAAERR